MIKYFCDQCWTELTNENICVGGILEGSHKSLQFSVSTTKHHDAKSNGDWCKYCVIDAVASLDNRDRAVPG